MDKGDYWSGKKEEFLQQMQQQGFDLYACQDYLEQRGLPSLDDYIIKDNLQNPNYINPLKGMPQQPQQQQVMYGYNPNAQPGQQ